MAYCSSMSAPASHDELHDLSPEDAQELRAFLDKRKWFEAKLKVGFGRLNPWSSAYILTS